MTGIYLLHSSLGPKDVGMLYFSLQVLCSNGEGMVESLYIRMKDGSFGNT